MNDTEKLYKLKSKIMWMLQKYKDEREYFHGYRAIEWLNNSAPEDDCQERTDWYTIRDYADDMYYMLSVFESIIDEMQEIIDGDE